MRQLKLGKKRNNIYYLCFMDHVSLSSYFRIGPTLLLRQDYSYGLVFEEGQKTQLSYP